MEDHLTKLSQGWNFKPFLPHLLSFFNGQAIDGRLDKSWINRRMRLPKHKRNLGSLFWIIISTSVQYKNATLFVDNKTTRFLLNIYIQGSEIGELKFKRI